MSSRLPSVLSNVVRAEFEDTCKRRFFFGPGFEAYGGSAGLYDLGPPLCSLKANLLAYWRQHFVLEEGICEVDTTCCTPYEVLDAVGHVERFNDIMAKDKVTGECVRVDKHVEEWCEKQLAEGKGDKDTILSLQTMAESMTPEELGKALAEHKILSKEGNELGTPFPFNLMFKSPVGAEGQKEVFMRPELAQGIILNFKRLLDSGNATRLPFAAAAVGQAFRNEIAPRCNLLRVREFTLAEIEHFVDPMHKAHPKFDRVKDIKIWTWSKEAQLSKPVGEWEEVTIGAAVESGLIDNQTLGYFIGRTHQFLQNIGLSQVRWRQHVKLAHYAQDCWDAEALTTYGWYEIIGIADRSAYDLTCHMKATKKEMHAREDYAEPKMMEVVERKVNKGVAGKKFGKQTGEVVAALQALSDEEALALDAKLNEGPTKVGDFEITRELVKIGKKTEKVTGRNFTPSVIEPSFGIGRIMYALLEQNYSVRRDDTGKNEKRAVFSFTPLIAPQKVAIFPLMVKPQLEPIMKQLREEFIANGISSRSDDSGAAIGKKYARVDELGIPFCVTCDFEDDGKVTLRERDTSKQVRVPISEVVSVVKAMCNPITPRTWDSVLAEFPAQN